MMRSALSICAVLLFCSPALSKTLTREEALLSAFPGAQIQTTMVFLTEAERQEAARISGVDVPTSLIARYVARKDGKVLGCAYLDTHVVRTKKESLLILVYPDGKLKRVERIVFEEPPEYIPPDRWYQQLENKLLNDQLKLGRSIHPVTGATLTARATMEAVRRVLAIDQVLRKKEASQKP